MEAKDILKKLSGGEGLTHGSPSQYNQTLGMWIVDYFCRTKKQRSSDKKNYKLGYGAVCSNVAQKLVGRYYFHGVDREEIKDHDYDNNFKYEYGLYLKDPKDEFDLSLREKFVDKLHATTKNVLKAVKEIHGSDELSCERTVEDQPQNLIFKIQGRIDYEGKVFSECKTKPPKVNGYTTGLPKDPQTSNIRQVAFYRFASDKEPFIFYANEKDYIIFDRSHPALKDDHLEYAYNEMIQKAFTIQKLLFVSNGDPQIMASLVEKPDLEHWMMSDVSPEQIKIIKKLWG